MKNKKIIIYTLLHSLIISLLLVFLFGSLFYLLINLVPIGIGVIKHVKNL